MLISFGNMNWRKVGFVLVVLLITGILVGKNLFPKEKVLSPSPVINSPKLETVVTSALAGTNSTYGIVIKNFKTGEKFYLNENRVFTSASLYKLWVAKEAYQRIKNQELRMEDEITEKISDLNSYYGMSDEEAEFTDGIYSMTVGEAINQMITISHNNSALALAKKLQIKDVRPQVTPLVVANFFERLYFGKMVDATASAQLLAILKKQENKEMIPNLLPENTIIAHKTGNLEKFTHDGGIVFSPKGDFLIVLMSESEYPPGAKERMAKISRMVFDHFVN